MIRIRWSDNDRNFGPFTWATSTRPEWGIVLTSGGDEEANNPSYARLHLARLTVLWAMPSFLLRPHRQKVKAKFWDEATIQRMGRDWYWDIHKRQVGFQISEGVLHLYFGKQTDEWPGSKSKCIFFPWREWRSVRHSLYGLSGELFAHMPQWHGLGEEGWQERERLQSECPVAQFSFADFDGEVITATCRIEERESKLGAGRFKWLSVFRKSQIDRSLDLRFSSEVGRRKGSWKGGTIGHSITMRPGELHEAAFRRYCDENGLAFIGETA